MIEGLFLHILFRHNNTIALIEFAKTKPLKIHGLSGVDLIFTVGSGKCVFRYEDSKNKRKRLAYWDFSPPNLVILQKSLFTVECPK